MTRPLDADDLIAVADHCIGTLQPLTTRDWSTKAANVDWTCRETLEHVCALSYAPILALRAEQPIDLAFAITDGVPVDWLLVTARTTAVIVAEVARAASPDVRAYHPAGRADPSGFIAMMASELVVHTADIAAAFDAPYRPDDFVLRSLLDRLFPWWPHDNDPWDALQWCHGRGAVGEHPDQADSWIWHCAPLAEWDGAIAKWDPVTRTKRAH